MTSSPQLAIDGQVRRPARLTHEDLLNLPPESQVEDVRQLGAKREGRGVQLWAVLAAAEPRESADYLGLHASADNFHASIPLAPVLDKAVVIYSQGGQPLATGAGGPFRLFIPDHTDCQVSEIDECANVKFLDRIELTSGKGFDNRPQDEESHRALHEAEQQEGER